jgi:hypothetical protein
MSNVLGYLFLFKQKALKRINMPFICNELVTALPLSRGWAQRGRFFYRLVETH